MKLFRFMSKTEFLKYLKGEELYNNTKHQAKTDSIGFCFFGLDDVTPEFAWKFIRGAIYPDICVVFETDEKELKKGYGIYNDPNKTLYELMNFIPKIIKVPEYSITKYNAQTFKVIKFTNFRLNIFEKYEKFEWVEVQQK